MNGVRLHVFKLWAKISQLARSKDPNKLSTSLGVWVVDFDGQVAPYLDDDPIVGIIATRAVETLIDSGIIHPGCRFRTPADFWNDPMRVRESVYNQDTWAAVVMNPNATAMLRAAVEQGNTSYDPKRTGQIIVNSARDQNVASTIPQALSPGVAFTRYDLRPFGPPIATPAVSIGQTYLIILSFSFTFFLPIHMKYNAPKSYPPLHFCQLIIWRWVATVVSYFFLSCVYSLMSLAFLMPMSNPPTSHTEPAVNPNVYSYGTFVVYWMINWVAMTAFQLACENMAMLLGTPWTALWLIFWVVSNVTTGFYSLPLSSVFYRWGYAWPMHSVVEATRSSLFDLHPRIGLNFGILFVWCAIDTTLFPFTCFYMHWRTIREKKMAAQREAEWQEKMRKDEPCLFTRVTTNRPSG
ncbi:hypothetical protein K432DRAFT_413608 [Lepidopterella palustris CBS 459.81]|uniref:DUF3533 domain-containing protein n=1 Tax=Lepidopterella palustris CBS 459.81 TaxID=1314670 RepID=A0A8E2JJQ5_9PEZI|nr:hypothetical protein K432DRAFT_413608 [Lepidopterella palustris CBS 459.81]